MGSMQRGGIVRKNDNGTLERIDGSRTYIGSATLPSGKVVTKRFRRNGFDEDEVAERWLKWQGKSIEKEETEEEEVADMAEKNVNNKAKKCPFGGSDCTPSCAMYSDANLTCSLKVGAIGLFNLTGNFMKLDPNESLELIALAIGEMKLSGTAEETPVAAAPTEEDGLNAFLDGKTFLNFVNLHGKAVAGQYTRFCKENGFPVMKEKDMLVGVSERFPELKRRGVRGGSIFEAA